MKIPMLCGSSSSSASQPGRKSKASSSGTKKEESRSAQASSQQDAQSSGPTLKRSNSQPARLPSSPHQPGEVKTARQSITRLMPDTKPPVDFEVLAKEKGEGATLKRRAMILARLDPRLGSWIEEKIESSPEYMDLLKSVHPKYDKYDYRQQSRVYSDLATTHPKIWAEMVNKINEWHAAPTHATSRRVMEPKEQKFLTKAMQRIKEDVAKKPFHIHGEFGVAGTKKSEIRWFGHNPGDSIEVPRKEEDKYHLHSHPTLTFDSPASLDDHGSAATGYELFKAKEYYTNGKDVLQIHPTSMELVQLIPDPKVEKKLGKFPEAFRLPDPQQPSYLFSNHEAPAALNKEWEPPAGWRPDPNYPRTEHFNKKKMPPTDLKPPEDTPSAQADPRPDLPFNSLSTPSATRPIEPPPTVATPSRPPRKTGRPRVRFAEGT